MAAGALNAAVIEGKGAGRQYRHVAELTPSALHPAREVAVDVLDGSGAGCVWVHEKGSLKHKSPNPAHRAHANWGHDGHSRNWLLRYHERTPTRYGRDWNPLMFTFPVAEAVVLIPNCWTASSFPYTPCSVTQAIAPPENSTK